MEPTERREAALERRTRLARLVADRGDEVPVFVRPPSDLREVAVLDRLALDDRWDDLTFE